MKFNFDSWNFDPITSGLTVIFAPVLFYFVISIRKFIKSTGKYIIDGLIYGLSKTLFHKVAATLTLKKYAKLQLSAQDRYLHVPASVEVSLDIEEIFVPLVLEQVAFKTAFTHSNLLEAGNRIRIIGDPGSGKSSITRKIFRDECHKAQKNPRKARFPIYLELRKLIIPNNVADKNLGEWLFNFFRNQAAKHDVYEIEKCFDACATNVGLLIILDGLDEVSSTTYERVRIAINSLSEKLHHLGPNNTIILTLRVQFHHQVRKNYESFFPVVLSLKRFTPTDIYDFLTRWPFPSRKSQNIIRIYNDLTDRPALREMCTNPLVLSMYVAQHTAAGQQVAPDSRTEFYSKVTDELLIRRRAAQVGIQENATVLREQRQRILGKIAFQHLIDKDQPTNFLDWKKGVQTTSEITGLVYAEAEKLLRRISQETGLISEEREGETFRFIHLTFCEFLAAFEAVQGQIEGWKILVEHQREFSKNSNFRARLVEVLPFACALMLRHKRHAALSELISLDDSHIVSLAFLETKLYAHQDWNRFMEKERVRLLSQNESSWDSAWLKEVHLFLVVASDADRAQGLIKGISKNEIITTFFQSLTKHSSESIIKLIASYATQDATAAFRVANLCEISLLDAAPEVITANCDQPPFLAITVEEAATQPALSRKWAHLFAEAGMKSLVTATALSKIESSYFTQDLAKVNRRNHWYYSKWFPKNFYTEALTISYSDATPLHYTPIMNELKKISAPGSMRMAIAYISIFQWIFILTYSLTLASMFLQFVGITSTQQSLGDVAHKILSELRDYSDQYVFLLVLGLVFWSLYMYMRYANKFLAYRRILNLPATPGSSIYPYFLRLVDMPLMILTRYKSRSFREAFLLENSFFLESRFLKIQDKILEARQRDRL